MTRKRATNAHIDGLNPDDPGIALLGEALRGEEPREILLVCSGDVPGVGPLATRLVLDIRELEGSMSRAVPVTDAHRAGSPFGNAIVWPRSHLGKDFTYWCLAKGAISLRSGGVLWCAARKAKGAGSLTDEIGAMMGEVDVVRRDRGYRLLRARRTDAFDESRARAHLEARYTIEDDVLPGLSLASGPGVFSRRELDAGTRQLILHARERPLEPSVVLDLGCGVGPLALWAAARFSAARVLAVDSNLRAVALAQANARTNGLDSRVQVVASDGLPASDPGGMRGTIELALVNPPTHAEPEQLGRMAEQLRDWLAPGGLALLVVSRAGRMTEQLRRAGATVQAHPAERYTVLDATWGR